MSKEAIRLSFIVGLLSLSQEIVWVRFASFGHQGRPQALSLVLTSFLLGIAFGALLGRWRCKRSTQLLKESGRWLMLAGAIDSIILLASPFALTPNGASMLLLSGFIILSAGLKGVIFPIVHHLGTNADLNHLGRSISKVYVANVMGATLGPLLTGFFLLSVLSAGQVFALIAVSTMLTGLLTTHGVNWSAPTARISSAGFIAIALALLLISFDPLQQVAIRGDQGSTLGPMIQNRQGIVHLASATDGAGAITYGGNIYDGRASADLMRNVNRLDRAYFAALLHPAPRRILVIGLSTGAWTHVVAGLKDIEQIDVIEINPAYLELIKDSPELASILKDPRIKIHVDDGRRWLRAHPEKRYDLVIQNTTFHWRAYTTMLLSFEYFEEVRQHLNPGGIVACNSTGSLDVYYTAGKVFRYALRYENFVYMSDHIFQRRPDALAYLLAAKVGSKEAFSETFLKTDPLGLGLLEKPLENAEHYIRNQTNGIAPETIRDLNLVPEMRHGRAHPMPWIRPFLPANPNTQ